MIQALALLLASSLAMSTIPTSVSPSQHSGAEAWYVLAGAQCLEMPDRIIVANAGEGAVVPEGPPMALSDIGRDIRRSVVLVIHDSSQPWMTMTSDWAPQGRCPQ